MVKSDYLVIISLFLGVLLGLHKIVMRSNLKKNILPPQNYVFGP